jgi:sec-independent protein translocase protein TatA
VFNIGPQELIIILVLALIIFGPKRLPEMGKNIGKGLREIRQASAGIRQDLKSALDENPAPGRTGSADSQSPNGRPADGPAGNPSGASTGPDQPSA